jgi:hypothetical protein
MESGIDKHWDDLEKYTMPLVIRTSGFEFEAKSYAQALSLEDIKWSFYLMIIGCNLALVSIFIEHLHKKFDFKINFILLNKSLKRFFSFTYNSLKHNINLFIAKLKSFKI